MQIYTALTKVEPPIKIKTYNFGGFILTMIITFGKDFANWAPTLNALLQRIPMEAAMEITLVKDFTSFPHLFWASSAGVGATYQIHIR